MNTLIIYATKTNNTPKIAAKIAQGLGCEMKKVNEIKPEELKNYDLVGFGSGIYMMKHHKDILNLAKKLPDMSGKKCFIFSTSGRGGTEQHKKLNDLLIKKGFEIVGEWGCKALDLFFIFKLFGGFNKGLPNEKDYQDALVFGKKLGNKISKTK